jgi:murein DD-endopeptidase MepM/ murein hydrolase activator NlpD
MCIHGTKRPKPLVLQVVRGELRFYELQGRDAKMLRRRYYILFVSRDEDGQLRKIPVPLHYAYGFIGAALVGAFTMVGLAGSYTRILLKTENLNQIRQDRENLRMDYKRMAQTVRDRNVEVASLGALASEVSALYGIRLGRPSPTANAAFALTPASLAHTDDVNERQAKLSIEQFYALRTDALSGRVSRALEGGLSPGFSGDWTELADAPSLWPLEGRVTSGFGERLDPMNGEGAFHTGIDISAPYGSPVRAAGDGNVTGAAIGSGYGLALELDHGHDVLTVYGHLSAVAVFPGQHVIRGQVIGYVGQSGRATGPHPHYEVRVHNTPVNPHSYLRSSFEQVAAATGSPMPASGK